jgi:hypothetical protein
LGWPDPPADHRQGAFWQARYQAELDAEQAERREQAAELAADAQLRRDRQRSEQAAEDALNKSVHDARLDVAKTAIERGRGGAEFVRNAAAAIVTLYTGVLGVAFATSAEAEPLPARGLAPGVFLGVAIAAASAYVALLTETPRAPAPSPHSDLATFQERRLNVFIAWASDIAMGRAYFLHASVIALALGVLFLPAPFIEVADWLVLVAGAAGVAATFLIPRWTRPAAGSTAPG